MMGESQQRDFDWRALPSALASCGCFEAVLLTAWPSTAQPVPGYRSCGGSQFGTDIRAPVPRKQAVELGGLGISGDNALQHVCEIGQRIDAVQLGRGDERGGDRPMFGAGIVAGEQRIFSA